MINNTRGVCCSLNGGKQDIIMRQIEKFNITCDEHVETFFAILVKRLRATLSGIQRT